MSKVYCSECGENLCVGYDLAEDTYIWYSMKFLFGAVECGFRCGRPNEVSGRINRVPGAVDADGNPMGEPVGPFPDWPPFSDED